MEIESFDKLGIFSKFAKKLTEQTGMGLISSMWPVAVNYSLAAPPHAPYQVDGGPLWDVVPFLDQHGTKLLDTSWLDLKGFNSKLQLIPHMLDGIEVGGSGWVVQTCIPLPLKVLPYNKGSQRTGIIVPSLSKISIFNGYPTQKLKTNVKHKQIVNVLPKS